jgi:hypothetical protein
MSDSMREWGSNARLTDDEEKMMQGAAEHAARRQRELSQPVGTDSRSMEYSTPQIESLRAQLAQLQADLATKTQEASDWQEHAGSSAKAMFDLIGERDKAIADLATMTAWAAGLERGCVTVGEIDGERVRWTQDNGNMWRNDTFGVYVWLYNGKFYWRYHRIQVNVEGHEPTLREAMIAAVEAVRNA